MDRLDFDVNKICNHLLAGSLAFYRELGFEFRFAVFRRNVGVSLKNSSNSLSSRTVAFWVLFCCNATTCWCLLEKFVKQLVSSLSQNLAPQIYNNTVMKTQNTKHQIPKRKYQSPSLLSPKEFSNRYNA